MTQNSPPNNVIYPENVPRLRKAWTYATGDAIESSAVVAGEIVYIGSRDAKLYALEARTGALLWSYTTGNAIESSSAVEDGLVFVGSMDSTLYALSADTGDKLWSYTAAAGIQSSPTVA